MDVMSTRFKRGGLYRLLFSLSAQLIIFLPGFGILNDQSVCCTIWLSVCAQDYTRVSKYVCVGVEAE